MSRTGHRITNVSTSVAGFFSGEARIRRAEPAVTVILCPGYLVLPVAYRQACFIVLGDLLPLGDLHIRSVQLEALQYS